MITYFICPTHTTTMLVILSQMSWIQMLRTRTLLTWQNLSYAMIRTLTFTRERMICIRQWVIPLQTARTALLPHPPPKCLLWESARKRIGSARLEWIWQHNKGNLHNIVPISIDALSKFVHEMSTELLISTLYSRVLFHKIGSPGEPHCGSQENRN